jgi:ERCC4-type nuclease
LKLYLQNKNLYNLNNDKRYNFNKDNKISENNINVNIDNISIINNNNLNKVSEEEKYNIIVDFREMGAKTPYYLYKNNFNIINGSLEVGDYILTNNYCIERKSISTNDLYQSLNSKHLVEQTIKMGKYYKNIIILLEFEEHINVLNTFDNGIFYKPIILRKLLDLTNITELEKNHCLFLWSLNCKMSSIMLRNLRIKLNDEILDINYCLNINKINKGKKTEKSNSISNENNQFIINSNSQKIKTIDSFLNLNKTNNKMEIEKNIEQYEIKNNDEGSSNKIMAKKLDISLEKILRNIQGINSSNYNIINDNFNNLYDLITCDKEKKYQLLGRINGTKINSLFNLLLLLNC